jgi:hypothetical protein
VYGEEAACFEVVVNKLLKNVFFHKDTGGSSVRPRL